MKGVVPSAGIQSLTIILAISLTLATGLLVGALTISTGNRLLQRTRDNGDASVAQCLDSGEADLRLIAGRYLETFVGRVADKVLDVMTVPERALNDFAALARAHHPDNSTSPDFINDIMRKTLRTRASLLQPLGTDQVMYYSLPYSPSHIGEPWGGYVAFLHADETFGILPTDGTIPLMVMESRLADGSFGLNTSVYELGECDELGNMINRDKPCKGVDVNWPAGDTIGLCPMPADYVDSGTGTSSFTEMTNRGLQNIATADEPLFTPDVVQYSPILPYFSWLSIWASLTFTHRDMVNLTPRQGGRVGMFLANVKGEGIAEIFTKVHGLPPGSHLYSVDRNAWTGEVGKMIAYNGGRFVDHSPPPKAWEVIPLDIRNHTDVEGSGIPSVIAEHGRFVFSQKDNYTGMANTTAGGFLPWVAPNGTLYWTVTYRLEKLNFVMFINMLVPRTSVMETIDLSRDAIRDKTASNKRESDSDQQESLVMMISVTTAVVAVLMAVAIVFTRIIISPLDKLAHDMANVAVMNLEAVDLYAGLSKLSEVSQMQQSFRQMVRNLIEYRNYMPQSVLVKDTDEETDNVSTGIARSKNSHNPDVTMSVESSSRRSSQHPGVANFRDEAMALKKRSISAVSFNLKNWHGHIDGKQHHEIVAGHAEVVNIMMQAVQLAKGVCDVFSGDRLLALFNAFAPLATHRAASLQAAHAARTRVSALDDMPDLSFGIGSGDSRVGHMGCQGMKKVSVVSGVLPWACALERFNLKHGYTGLLDKFTARDVQAQYHVKCVDAVIFPKRSSQPIVAYELVGTCTAAAAEEWMYQLQSLEASSLHGVWNKVFISIVAGEWEVAEEQYNRLSQVEDEGRRLAGYISKRQFDAATIGYH